MPRFTQYLSIWATLVCREWGSDCRRPKWGISELHTEEEEVWFEQSLAYHCFNFLGHHESESEVAQSCLTLCDPMDCSLPSSSVHGILQARILEWVAISFSRGSLTQGSNLGLPHCRQILYHLSHQGIIIMYYKISNTQKIA